MASLPSRRDGRLVSITAEVDTGDPLDYFANRTAWGCYWERPFDGFSFCGLGSAWQTTPSAGSPPANGGELASLSSDSIILSSGSAAPGPMLFGAFPFPPVPSKSNGSWRLPQGLVFPEVAITRIDGQMWVTLNQMVRCSDELALEEKLPPHPYQGRVIDSDEPGVQIERIDAPGPAGWNASIDQALRAIDRGDLEKVVLARCSDRRFSTPINPRFVLERLRASYPETSIFGVSEGQTTFLGASPERLAKVTRESVEVPCLAGSIGRGDNEREDYLNAERLLTDEKNRREHRAVRNFVAEALTPLCADLAIDPEPSIVTVKNIHHLFSYVEGALKDGNRVLDVIRTLHPTPAVAGTPREDALRFIGDHEPFERGLFAGAVGWVNLSGEGDFTVALRSGLLEGSRARVFAGCGIVAGSEPNDEWRETELKLQPMLSALGAG